LPCGSGKTAAARTLNLSYAFGPIRASLIDGAKLRQLHCGFRIFVRLFLKNRLENKKQGDSRQGTCLSAVSGATGRTGNDNFSQRITKNQ
jgi:hypothetical protein